MVGILSEIFVSSNKMITIRLPTMIVLEKEVQSLNSCNCTFTLLLLSHVKSFNMF